VHGRPRRLQGNRCYPSVKKSGKPGRNEPTGNKQNQLTNSATGAGGEGDCPIIKDLGNPLRHNPAFGTNSIKNSHLNAGPKLMLGIDFVPAP
jgi:hypothetical protein